MTPPNPAEGRLRRRPARRRRSGAQPDPAPAAGDHPRGRSLQLRPGAYLFGAGADAVAPYRCLSEELAAGDRKRPPEASRAASPCPSGTTTRARDRRGPWPAATRLPSPIRAYQRLPAARPSPLPVLADLLGLRPRRPSRPTAPRGALWLTTRRLARCHPWGGVRVATPCRRRVPPKRRGRRA